MVLRLTHLRCSFPGCNNTVGQHNSKSNKNKQVCAEHRGKRKHEVDRWKMSQGCANRDGKYDFQCVSTDVINPVQLDINHIDGNNDNRDESNIECLCAMCHRLVTILENHHIQHNSSRKPKFADTGLFTGLLY
jgi:hypothetical protein